MTHSEFDTIMETGARWLLGGFFVFSGFDNLLSPFVTAEALNLPGAVLLIGIIGLFKILFGLSLAIRYHTKYVSMILAIYMSVVSIVFYGPQVWGDGQVAQFVFGRNVAIVGGLLFICAHSRGLKLWSEDAWPSKAQRNLIKEKPNTPPHP